MLTFYGNLFWLSLRSIPSSLGSNWLGLIWPAIVVAVGEIIACFAYGWRTMIAKWKQATLIGLASLGCCYLALFAWCAVAANYGEYSRLSTTNTGLARLVDNADYRQHYAVLEAQNECAKTLGKNEVLSDQNRDQQNTINNCQSNALKMLTPPKFDFKMHLIGGDDSTQGSDIKYEIVFLANKPITPVRLGAKCERPIATIKANVMTSLNLTVVKAPVRISEYEYELGVMSPAWGPDAPMVVTLTLTGQGQSNSIPCTFGVDNR